MKIRLRQQIRNSTLFTWHYSRQMHLENQCIWNSIKPARYGPKQSKKKNISSDIIHVTCTAAPKVVCRLVVPKYKEIILWVATKAYNFPFDDHGVVFCCCWGCPFFFFFPGVCLLKGLGLWGSQCVQVCNAKKISHVIFSFHSKFSLHTNAASH